MNRFEYETDRLSTPALGLIVLQTDETIESDFRRMIDPDVPIHVSRVPSAPTVSSGTLQQMQAHLTQAATLLPAAAKFGAVGYGCTSGTAQIGQGRIADLVRQGVETPVVTEPVTALLAACEVLGLKRLAFLSPYVAEVSDHLRNVLKTNGIDTSVFGSFEEAEEAKVVRISADSLMRAAMSLANEAPVDGVFMSCTNLRCLPVIETLEGELGMPVLSSNQVLAWHMARQAGIGIAGQWGVLTGARAP